MRQLDFYNPLVHDPNIVVIGAGGIGSYTVLQLSKLGVRRIRVYDGDRVAPHNISTTPYTAKDIGKPKATALQHVVTQSGGPKIVAVKKFYTGGKLPKADILISAVDSMEGRRQLFKQAVRQEIPFFIDGRIGGENLRVYAIRPGQSKDRRLYRSTLVPDHRVSPLPCTAQQVSDVGLAVTSQIVRAVRKWVAEGSYIPEVIVRQNDQKYLIATPVETRKKRRIPDEPTEHPDTPPPAA